MLLATKHPTTPPSVRLDHKVANPLPRRKPMTSNRIVRITTSRGFRLPLTGAWLQTKGFDPSSLNKGSDESRMSVRDTLITVLTSRADGQCRFSRRKSRNVYMGRKQRSQLMVGNTVQTQALHKSKEEELDMYKKL
jgi:hypothetical protein